MSLFAAELVQPAEALLASCRAKRLKIATAESCTGGLVAGLLTSISGSSEVFDRGFVTYSNDAKRDMLGVELQTLVEKGAVSAECAREMAHGALKRSDASIAVSVTGIAGPAGGSPEKPIGLVYFACGSRKAIIVEEKRFGALGRDGIRLASVAFAVDLLAAQAA
jgi:nicotinamide-nucleotide amidase